MERTDLKKTAYAFYFVDGGRAYFTHLLFILINFKKSYTFDIGQ